MSNAGKKFSVETLEPEEVKSLVGQCNPRYRTGCRNQALIVTLYRAGLRIDEALSLEPRDLSDDGTIRVRHGKGDKARVVAIDQNGLSVIKKWLDWKAKLGITGPIFSTLKGTKMYSQYVRQLLPRIAKKAGIQKRVHPHGLRHSFASSCAQEGMPLRIISKALGHSTFATTQTYLDHVCPSEITDAMKSRSW